MIKLWSNTRERTQSKEKEQAEDSSYPKGIGVRFRETARKSCHLSQNKYSYKYEIKSKTIDPHQITNITDLINSKKITTASNYRQYRYCRFY